MLLGTERELNIDIFVLQSLTNQRNLFPKKISIFLAIDLLYCEYGATAYLHATSALAYFLTSTGMHGRSLEIRSFLKTEVRNAISVPSLDS